MRVAVIIPCYRVRKHVLTVLAAIGPEVERIYCVDDACPDGSGKLIESECRDPRVTVLRHMTNQGVGGAMCTGYARALADGMDICVKLDGDGQMDPALIPVFVAPIATGLADYTKGNRFFNLEDTQGMPRLRLFGNAMLSFLTKWSSGYWSIFDPTNGFTAVHRAALGRVSLGKLDRRFFFESDLLFRLYLARAVAVDIPMKARYGDERSNLKIARSILPFYLKNLRNGFKRLLYSYFLREFNMASLEMLMGLPLLLFGIIFGAVAWIGGATSTEYASAGTVMLSALPIIVGFQLLLAALGFDLQAQPRVPLQRLTINPNAPL